MVENSYTYTFLAKDLVSNKLSKLSATADSVYAKLSSVQQQYNQALQNNSKSTSTFGSTINKLGSLIQSSIGNDATGEFKELDTTVLKTHNNFKRLFEFAKKGGEALNIEASSEDAIQGSRGAQPQSGASLQTSQIDDENNNKLSTLATTFGTALTVGTSFYQLLSNNNSTVGSGFSTLVNKLSSLKDLMAGAGGGDFTGALQEGMTLYSSFMDLTKTGTELMKSSKAVQFVVIGLTKGWATAQRFLNIAFKQNPIGFVVTGITALIVGIRYAWKNFEGFRGVVMGVWETIKGFASLIKTYVVDRVKELIKGFMGLGKVIGLIFDGKFSAAADAGKKAFANIAGVESKTKAFEAAKKAGENFTKGYQKGVNYGNKSPQKEQDGMQSAIPGIPGNGSGDSNSLNGAVTPGVDSITGGGSGQTNINVTVGKLVENISLQSSTIHEGINDIREMVQEELLKVLNSANKLAY